MYGRDMKSQIATVRAYRGATGSEIGTIVKPEPLAEIEPINRESMEQRVAGTLRDLIVSGQLPAGTPLVQRDLAQRLGVSQTPVRVSLSALEREGLVQVGETGRALVSPLTREDLEEIYAARLGLEGLAARVGVAAIGDDEVERMRVMLAELDRLAKRRDVESYLQLRWDFHAVCYEASRRPRLLAEVERLFWRAERYNHLVLSSAERFRRSVGYYHEFFAACERRNPLEAERVIHESVGGAVDLIWPTLPSELEDVAG
jgi:DNA-binding GntR family transcriptional regulator